MKLFKLTEQDFTTHNGSTKWGEGVTHQKKKKENPQLCSADVFHAYSNINLGLLLNPVHADIDNPVLWECEGEVVVRDYGKVGCFKITTLRQLTKPKWFNTKKDRLVRVAFAILCAEAVIDIFEKEYPDDKRPRKAIKAAKEYLKKPTANVFYAAKAAYATYAANAAAKAAYATTAAYAAYAAAKAAKAAYAAAYATTAAYAAYAAANYDIDFDTLADQAVKMIRGEKNEN